MAAATIGSSKIFPHEPTPRLVVSTVELLRYLVVMTWNKELRPRWRAAGSRPRSSPTTAVRRRTAWWWPTCLRGRRGGSGQPGRRRSCSRSDNPLRCRPLRNAPRIAPLITAIGISFFLENSALLLFGAQYRIYNTSDFISLSSGIQIGSVTIDSVQIMVLVMGLLLMVGLRQLVNRTRLGKQMRAVAVDREAAEMLGINVNFTIAATFFIGSALAGVAGVMAGLLFNQVTSTIGFIAGLKAFTASVVGGIGSIPGAMLGGLLIGIAESFITGYVSSTYTNLLVFGLLIAVMLVRPTGLLGQAQLQKV